MLGGGGGFALKEKTREARTDRQSPKREICTIVRRTHCFARPDAEGSGEGPSPDFSPPLIFIRQAERGSGARRERPGYPSSSLYQGEEEGSKRSEGMVEGAAVDMIASLASQSERAASSENKQLRETLNKNVTEFNSITEKFSIFEIKQGSSPI